MVGRQIESTGNLNLIQNRLEVHGTWFYLPAVSRILASTKWKQTFKHYQKDCSFQRELISTAVHTQKWLPHSFVFAYLRLMFTTPSNDSTYMKVNIAFPVLSHLALSHHQGLLFSLFHRNMEHRNVMKYCRRRLHVRLKVGALPVANWYTEMCSISLSLVL